MFGARRALEKALSVVLAENADLKQRLRDSDVERAKLLDRIMALTNPGALREVTRPPLPRPEAPPADSPESDEAMNDRGSRYPGSEVYVPPSRPATPPEPRFAPTPDQNEQAS